MKYEKIHSEKTDYGKQPLPEKALATRRIEEKYYITLALLKAVSDGNTSKALEHAEYNMNS